MTTQILIDGIDYTNQVAGLESLVISLQKDDNTKTVNTVVSSELTFYGDAYQYLLNRFFDEPESKDKESEVEIITSCCNDTYNLLIRADAVTVCFSDCNIVGQLVERSQDLEAFNSIRNVVTLQAVLDGTVDTTLLESCKDVGFLNVALWVLVEVLERIVAIFDTIPLVNLGGLLSDISNYQTSLLGCQVFKQAIRVRDVMEVCAADAGLTFSSTIFSQPPYIDLFYVDTNNTFSFLTCQQFFELMLPVFNADYQIRNGVLYFERKDFFLDSVVELVDVEQAYADGLADNAPCYVYTEQSENALGRFEYSIDNQDTRANIIKDLTNDIVEWNPNGQFPNRVGEFVRTIPFSPARFTRDRDSNPTMDARRPSRALILGDSALSQYPKLVIGDIVGPGGLSRLKPSRTPMNNASGKYNYSIEMWFDQAQSTPELYQQFHYIEDPSVTPVQPYELQPFTFVATCDQIQLCKDNGVDLFVSTRLGKGRPSKIDINYDNKTITVEGVKIEVA